MKTWACVLALSLTAAGCGYDFGTSVHENLERSTSTFQTSMGNSVELISVQMRNLTSALQDLPELLRKSA